MTSSSWHNFLADFEKNNNSPVLIPILKKTSLKNLSNNKAQVVCQNLGMKLFLETKRSVIESALSKWFGGKAAVDFLVKEAEEPEETQDQTPLLSYERERAVRFKKSGLQPKFSFDNFAVSPSNQIAHAAATAVAEKPTAVYNPLFIYGGVGVGKTHLLQAVGNHILKKNSNKRTYYCTSEEFTNDLVELIRAKNTSRFRKKYRSLDVLLVDDVQFLAGKNYIQEEFYHTFNALIRRGGQIALTSDRPPSNISKLEDRLRSRFAGGLTIDIQNPDFELRCAIVLIKAAEKNISIDMEAAKLLAEKANDARELEGKLLKIYSKTLRNNKEITIDLVRETVADGEKRAKDRLVPNDVIKILCSSYNIKKSQLRGSSRKEKYVVPRQIAMYILRTKLKLKLEDIALILKRKDHTTIMHGVDKITNQILKNPSFKEEIEGVIGLLDL